MACPDSPPTASIGDTASQPVHCAAVAPACQCLHLVCVLTMFSVVDTESGEPKSTADSDTCCSHRPMLAPLLSPDCSWSWSRWSLVDNASCNLRSSRRWLSPSMPQAAVGSGGEGTRARAHTPHHMLLYSRAKPAVCLEIKLIGQLTGGLKLTLLWCP